MEGDSNDTFLSDGSNSTMFSTSSSLENMAQVDSPPIATPVNKRKSLQDSSSDTESAERGLQNPGTGNNPKSVTKKKTIVHKSKKHC